MATRNKLSVGELVPWQIVALAGAWLIIVAILGAQVVYS
jgi:hypothetical protein